jgi:tetratricopeptide (TPR) repeat protein
MHDVLHAEHRRTWRWAIGAALLSLLIVGCQNNHKEWSDAGKQRWLGMRSSLVLQMAQQQFDTGDLTLAEKSVKDALAVDPTNPKLLVLAGRIEIERGQLERACHLFQAAITANEKWPPSRYYLGIVYQRWQQYQNALDAYAKAFELEPDNASYLLAMSEMLVSLDRTQDAIAALEDKLVYFDQNAALRATLAQLHLMQHDFAKAADYFRQASLLRPDDLKLQEEMAMSLLACARTDDAIRILERLCQEDTLRHRADLRRSLAGAYLKTGRDEQARALLVDVTKLDGANVEDWVKLAELHWTAHDIGATLSAANQIVTLAPQRHEGYLLAGLVWQERGRLDEALRLFDRAAALSGDAGPVILRGIALEKAGRRQAAAEAYADALRRNPQDERARRLLAGVTPDGVLP